MLNFSTKIGPGSPISPFTWIPQLLVFLNIEKNPRTWDVNCRHGVGLLSTSATCSGPPLDPGKCHTGKSPCLLGLLPCPFHFQTTQVLISTSKSAKMDRHPCTLCHPSNPRLPVSPQDITYAHTRHQWTFPPPCFSLQLLLFCCLISQMPLLKHPSMAVSRLAPAPPLWP